MWKAIRSFIIGADDISGAALVEFTIFAPMLLAIAIYTMDFGLLVFTKMEVQNAAQAGAQYAIMTDGYDQSSISSAVTGATRFTAITPASSEFCGCPTTVSGTVTGVTFCANSCNICNTNTCSLLTQGHYVTVTAAPTNLYTPLIRFGLLSSTYNLSATATVRIR